MQALYYTGVLILFSASALLFPEAFLPLRQFIVPLLGVIMLSIGLTLTPDDFKRILKNPLPITYGALLQYTIMPALGFLIPTFARLSPDLITGFVLVGSAPGGTASNLITYLAGGNVAYSISMTAISTLLAPLLTPFWTWLLAGKFVPVPFLRMMAFTFKIIIIPVGAGILIRYALKEGVKYVERVLPLVALLSIGTIIGVIFAVNLNELRGTSLNLLFLVLLHNASGFALGYAFARIARLSSPMQIALSVEVGMQNSGLSAVLALNLFSKTTALPSAIFSLGQNIIGILLAGIWKRNSGGKE